LLVRIRKYALLVDLVQAKGQTEKSPWESVSVNLAAGHSLYDYKRKKV
jgi:hypothetical protein